MKYKQVTVKVAHEETELASYAMIEAGSEGATVVDGADIKEVLSAKNNWDYYDGSLDAVDDTAAFVIGCFDESADLSPLADALKNYLGRDAETAVSLCDSVDWENEWKKYYEPIDFGRIVVVPKWLDRNFGKAKILIDPGMAFGTGTHETTGMCIELLSELDLVGKRVLDVGCGSGILGIAALKLGAAECTMIDIDRQAVDAAMSNLRLNGLTAEVLSGDLTEKYRGSADVVLANLTADILLRLTQALPCVTHPGSIIIMSGIINARAGDVLAAYGLTGGSGCYSLIDSRQKGEWQAFMVKKN